MDTEEFYLKTEVFSRIDVRTLVTVHRLAYHSGEIAREGERHPFYELVCVESGEFHVDIDGAPHTLLPGELILYAPNAYHAKSSKETRALIYIVSFETAEPIQADIFNRPLRLNAKQYALLSDLFTDALQVQRAKPGEEHVRGMVLYNSANKMALQKIKNRLELLLIELCETAERKTADITASNAENASNADMIRVSEFLQAHLHETLSLEDISSGCFMSVSKLKKLFARHHGGGIISYFNTLKIREAKQLIRNTDMKLTHISEALGFSYPHYFSRIFKEKTGMTPTEYAKHIDKR